jgi:pimeloyl-ACP methyl ester carboxylesterase
MEYVIAMKMKAKQRFTLCLFLTVWASAGGGLGAETRKPTPETPDRSMILRQDGGYLAYYHWCRPGPSLLLIPGSWSEYTQFDPVRHKLDPSLNLVIVELPGHGRSWPPTLEGSIESFATEVLRVTAALRWDSWFVGGHSIGGMVAIELAAQRPEQISGVISIEGWTHHHVLREAFGQNYNTLSQAEELQRQQERSKTLSRLSREQTTAFREIWRRWDGLRILRTTPVPILELWGDRDQPRPKRDVMRIPNRDNIQLRWIAGASHSLPLEEPGEVAAAINQFIHTRRQSHHEKTKFH